MKDIYILKSRKLKKSYLKWSCIDYRLSWSLKELHVYVIFSVNN